MGAKVQNLFKLKGNFFNISWGVRVGLEFILSEVEKVISFFSASKKDATSIPNALTVMKSYNQRGNIDKFRNRVQEKTLRLSVLAR